MNNLKPDRHHYKFAGPSSLLWRRNIAWLLTSVATGNSAHFLVSIFTGKSARLHAPLPVKICNIMNL
ncbi:hypothetical protein ACK1H3_002576 [Salmonella enterica]|nr:hypothetical protein [Salmonella enterica]EJH3115593.1 hypothetical protein [Salmonella enterica]EJV4635195.1 hypothetical protein [Salmonella enterica]ELV9201887.1 hypothetical protein [Salmonella enterica]